MSNDNLMALLHEIYEFGAANDRANQDKTTRMRNVTPFTGDFLRFMVQLTGAKRVLEIGTSNGYSTLWIADAVTSNQGVVTTLEYDVNKADLAAKNFAKSDLQKSIKLEVIDAGIFLQSAEEHSFDFIFMDSERVEYVSWWPHIQRALIPGGLIVVDNTVSHSEELKPFLRTVETTPGFQNIQLPIEQGVLLLRKEQQNQSL